MAMIAAVIGAASSIMGGIQASQQAAYQAKVADMNQKIAKQNAQYAMAKSQVEQEDQARQTAAQIGEQEAIQAGSGLSLSGMSERLTRRSARMLGRRDELNVMQQGRVEAYNYLTQAANFKAQSSAYKSEASSSLLGGFLGGIGSLIGESKSVGSAWA